MNSNGAVTAIKKKIRFSSIAQEAIQDKNYYDYTQPENNLLITVKISIR